MKKVLLFLGAFFFMIGCDNLMNTPTKRVEEFLNKYQTMDSVVMDQLNYTIDEDYVLNETQKEEYGFTATPDNHGKRARRRNNNDILPE